MESKKNGYKSQSYPFPTKRYYQCLDLVKDEEQIQEYIKIHSKDGHWPIINEGIKAVGILEMELFIADHRLFMVVVTKEDFDWDTAFAELATLPKQNEWEDFVGAFQACEKGQTSTQKWKLLERIFYLY